MVQFLAYAEKVFGLGPMLRGIRCSRPYPVIPTRALVVSLFMGVVLRVGSYLNLAAQTKRRRWQHLIHGPSASATTLSNMWLSI